MGQKVYRARVIKRTFDIEETGEKGTLLASGFIAGGALMGVVSAAMRFGGINLVNDAWVNNTWSEVLALGAYALLIIYFIKASMKTK